MRSDQFVRGCEILWGPQWRSRAAATLDVPDRTISYWAAGRKPIPEGVVTELCAAMAEQATLLTVFVRELNRGRPAA